MQDNTQVIAAFDNNRMMPAMSEVRSWSITLATDYAICNGGYNMLDGTSVEEPSIIMDAKVWEKVKGLFAGQESILIKHNDDWCELEHLKDGSRVDIGYWVEVSEEEARNNRAGFTHVLHEDKFYICQD